MVVALRAKMPASKTPEVFSPEGAIDLHVSPEVRASLRELIDKKPKRLIVDMSRVPYVDSSGLAVLIGAMQSLEHDGVEGPVENLAPGASLPDRSPGCPLR